ncbi:FxLYD domain-containing protein [Salinithrix halophila]|uniref:FxLYD domain-containing protein n=1 Tax=Salinithrix halophila TaxID=1485204 RepID=A0ABV8JBQ1_9BACL
MTGYRLKASAGLGLLAGIFLLAGCQASEEHSASKGESSSKKGTSHIESKSVAEGEKKDLKVTADQETGRAWKDKAGHVKVHGAARIKNTGSKPVELDTVQLNFLDKNEKVLGTKEVLAVVPKILKPGEVAYVGKTISLKEKRDPKVFDRVTISTDYNPALKPPVTLKTDKLSGEKSKDTVRVTGTIHNETGEKVKDIFVTAALRDGKGNLVAVVNEYLDMGIKAGKSTGFEVEDSSLPKELTKKVDEKQVKAQAYPLFIGEEK